jgi:hypothetical protein
MNHACPCESCVESETEREHTHPIR